jgi:hypothetical protein
METDPAVLAQMVLDFCKLNPLPSAAAALLLLFLFRRNTKNMLIFILLLSVGAYVVLQMSNMSDDAQSKQSKGFQKSIDIIEHD